MQIERKRMVLIAAAGAAGLLAAAQCSVPAFAETVQSGWFTQGNKRYYAYEDGSLAVGTVVINEIPYVFAPNGAQQTGWQTVNGKRYFYTKDGEAQFGWIKWRGEHYYVSDDYGKLTDETDAGQAFSFDKEGILLDSNWVQSADGTWYYANASGETVVDGTPYLFDQGGRLLTGWQTASDGITRYYDSARCIQTGWITEKNGTRFYADEKNGMLTGAQTIDGKHYLFGANGQLLTGFQKDSSGVIRYYDAETAEMQTGFCRIGDQTYYFAEDGAMQTAFCKVGDSTYRFRSNGTMVTGFDTIYGLRYYFGDDGVMRTGFCTVGDATYRFRSNGTMVTGFDTIYGARYYFGDDGIMRTGFCKVGQDAYYFSDEGKMQKGFLTVGGARYFFGDNGILRTGWITSGKDVCYADENGALVSGWKRIDGVIYYFNADYYRESGPVVIDGVTFLLNDSGIPQTGWYTAKNGCKYYGSANASALTGWQTVEGYRCYFDAHGVFRSGAAKIHGKIYVMDSQNTGNGGMICQNEDRFYVKPDGELVFGWVKDGGNLYYVQPDGTRTFVETKTKNNMALAYYAIRKLGCCYWYGTYGSIATEELYNNRKSIYPYYYRWDDFLTQLGGQVFDCCGLVKGYLWSSSVDSLPERNPEQDVSSTGMFTSATVRGTIDTCPWKIGTLLFRSDPTSNRAYGIHHVGVYIGNGMIMEAKGHEWGVILSSDPSFWTHWAQCKWTTDNGIVSRPN